MREYSIPENVLASFAEQIYVVAEEANDNHISLKAEVEQDDILYLLDFNGYAYFDKASLPSGDFPRCEHTLSQVVPVWCEVHAFNEDGEINTAFSSTQFTNTYLKHIN